MAGTKRTPDFSGWATKYGIKCSDGRTILSGAFNEMNGKKVPIVWGHIHDDPDMVLGHAILYAKPEGIWTEGYFNNNPKARRTKETLRNGDVDGLSIYANELKHVNGRQVQHGNIRELSVVLAGANKGATIENVLLAHGDLLDELDDECIIYNDDEPLFHDEDAARKLKKKKLGDEEDDEDEEDGDEPEEDEDEGSGEEDGDEDDEDDDEHLKHSDGHQIQDIWDSMSEEQQDLVGHMIELAAAGDEMQHSDEDREGMRKIWDSMSEEQQDLASYLIGEASEGGIDDEDDEDGGEDDAAEHSDIEMEDENMKDNVFERNMKKTPDDFLSHEDQAKIIERGKKLGSMKAAWEEALETNETLSHDVFNDDGTKQTYGIANIDYLFPDYQELNSTPEMIRRPDDWVNVVLNGVYKTPRARLRTTVANITMEEARAKGYTKGDKKDAEVFNLLRRTVDPQTIYKYQELDQDDVIDIDDFDVVAWIKVEMRIMLNEEIARAILLGDGRSTMDKYKIKEDHIKPIINDDDLYTIKITATAGSDDAATAKNAIRAIIKGRKHYKGSGNLVYFTSEDWLSEMLLLEDNFGHELYKDATELARKMRVQRIVTCPFFEDLEIDGQKVIGLAVDLHDYVTGTNRRGQIKFFDDFDIEFNKNQYLIETRLSGMLRKPFSAMVVKVATAQKGAPHYDEATLEGNENPKALGLFEKEGIVYRKSADVTVVANKTYYTRSIDVNPQ